MVGDVADGTAALEACRRDRPDVVVLDLGLPGAVQGLDVARAIRSEGLGARVLVLTGRVDDAAVFESVRAGVSGLVQKTEGMRSIADAIERVARGERVFTPTQERAAITELGRFARRARARVAASSNLTSRELEVLQYLAIGLTVRQVATRLGVSPRTVESHIARLYDKLGVRNRVQAISRAATLDLIPTGGVVPGGVQVVSPRADRA
jgi:DNA-binding NarL/FixJ family response regulator